MTLLDNPNYKSPEKILQEATENFTKKERQAMLDLLARTQYYADFDKNYELVSECEIAAKWVQKDTKGNGLAAMSLGVIVKLLGEETAEGLSFTKSSEDYMWASIRKDDQ
jgi:hypothetical protein